MTLLVVKFERQTRPNLRLVYFVSALLVPTFVWNDSAYTMLPRF